MYEGRRQVFTWVDAGTGASRGDLGVYFPGKF